MGQIVNLQKLEEIVMELKRRDKTIITTNGTFDILHVGHARALEKAKNMGDFLIVGMNSDSSVKRYKGEKRPIVPEAERAEMLASLRCVDYVVIFEEDDPRVILDAIKPHIHTKSGDWDVEKMPETPVVRKYGGEVIATPYFRGNSTTDIIERIREAYGQKTD